MGEYDALFDAAAAPKGKPDRGEYGALFDDTPAPPPGLIGSRGLGPGSIAPDLDATELPKVGMDRFAAHPVGMTDTERKAAQARGARESHTDDPGVQAIIGGLAGAGVSNLIGAGAGAVGAAGRLSRVAQGAGAGGTASKVQGGDFTTGALLGGGGAAVPEVAGALGAGARAAGALARRAGEGSIERSAAGGGAVERLKDVAGHAWKSGHVMLPTARAGAIVADEGVAAIARRLLKERGPAAAEAAPVAEPVGPAQSAAWDPEGWKHDQAPPPAEVAPVAGEDPNIAAAREALKTATPAQADALKKAIAGYQERAARTEAPSLGDKAAALQEVRSSGARPEVWGGRPANVGPVPVWEPGPGDAKYARGLNMTVDDYRAMMVRRAARASQ